jgi:hypothetical protein
MINKQKNNIKFLPRTDLIMPEYGRNIQQMVEYAVTVEDKNERTKCANSIINIMGNMFPYLRDVEGFKFKLWDHLAIMSRFRLDIDYPFEIIRQENLALKPNKINYSTKKMHYMHYGAIIENFIREAAKIEDEERKNALLISIANYMKKSLLAWNNKDIAIDDRKIFNDLREISKGEIALNSEDFQLTASEEFLRTRRKSTANNNNRKHRKTKKDKDLQK